MQNFRDKTMREIRIWGWIAAVAPMTSLAALFFIWAFGTEHLLNVAMIAGATAMFGVAVFWWWWALHAMKTLLDHWELTKDKVGIVLHEVGEVKGMVRDVIRTQEDK